MEETDFIIEGDLMSCDKRFLAYSITDNDGLIFTRARDLGLVKYEGRRLYFPKQDVQSFIEQVKLSTGELVAYEREATQLEVSKGDTEKKIRFFRREVVMNRDGEPKGWFKGPGEIKYYLIKNTSYGK